MQQNSTLASTPATDWASTTYYAIRSDCMRLLLLQGMELPDCCRPTVKLDRNLPYRPRTLVYIWLERIVYNITKVDFYIWCPGWSLQWWRTRIRRTINTIVFHPMGHSSSKFIKLSSFLKRSSRSCSQDSKASFNEQHFLWRHPRHRQHGPRSVDSS